MSAEDDRLYRTSMYMNRDVCSQGVGRMFSHTIVDVAGDGMGIAKMIYFSEGVQERHSGGNGRSGPHGIRAYVDGNENAVHECTQRTRRIY